MDDVDAVQAQIARNMLESGDWVSAQLNGIKYLEKSPLKYWMMAVSYRLFGVRDWAARIPLALCAVLLCWVTARFGAWAVSPRAGLWAGLALATCVGLFLFTRILIPDVILTLTVTLAMWSFLRALEEDEPHPRLWAAVMAAAIGTGLLLKGLIAAVFPMAAAFLYLAFTRQLFARRAWRRLRPFSGALILLGVAAPWHVLAILRNPPYFDFTLHSVPVAWRGFFWFYFLNEHVFRFLNIRHPRDYNTVPRLLFWLFHLLWLFPWSAFFPAAARLSYRPVNRAGRARLLALCWIGFLLVFFTFSTTQEYYSMPCYPALALLLGSAMAEEGAWIRRGKKAVAVVAALAACATGGLWFAVRHLPAPGDIAGALTQNPDAYTLSLGHLGDLTLASFAYLRLPLLVACAAMLVGVAAWRLAPRRAFFALALMMTLFLHAARLAMVAFDPYLGSRPLAQALLRAPEGQLIADDQYYTWSSVFFYSNRRALLLNGRVNNLEYGSYAPGAPDVFLADEDLPRLWSQLRCYYLLVEGPSVARIERLVGREKLHVVAASGGKYLFSNRPIR
ncbi:MAG: glycosyltransferase family 39 protein [Acidobacteria bacterium]|nr:glycosyltransferase family 39 protein [Acidobacteriota bacterium]